MRAAGRRWRRPARAARSPPWVVATETWYRRPYCPLSVPAMDWIRRNSGGDAWRTIQLRTRSRDPWPRPDPDVMATPDLSLTLPARAENVAVVRHAFGGLGDALDVDDQVAGRRQARGHRGVHQRRRPRLPSGDGPMEVAAAVRDGRLTIAVRDEGRGMLPRPDCPGLGLGLPLIATLAESLELGRPSDDRTEVRMTFRLDLNGRRERPSPNPPTRPRCSCATAAARPGAHPRHRHARRARPVPDRPARRRAARRRRRRRAQPRPRAQRHGPRRPRRHGGRDRADGRRAAPKGAQTLADAELPGVGNVLERVADAVEVRDDGEGGRPYIRLGFAFPPP